VIRSLTGRDGIRRILIIKWSALGDIAVASVAMEDVRRAFPRAEIHVNTLPPWDQLFRDDPRFSRVMAFPLRGRGPGATLRWIREVRRNRYDLIVDLQSNDRSRLMLALLALSGARVRHRLGNHPGFPYTISAPPMDPSTHAAERQRAALRAGGIPTVTPRPVLHVPARNRDRAAQLMARHGLDGRRFAVFFPGCQAAGHLKRWGVIRYSALAMYLLEAGYDRVVVMGAADEARDSEDIAAAVGAGVLNLCGQTEVLDLIPLCARARVIVANDTGTAHVTAATGTPMVVLFGPTDPARARPVGEAVHTLQAQIFCVNCYLKECSHQSCMGLISPERVYDLVQRITDETTGGE
jgi:lipopolysaccharide heptosyltransferase II